MADENAGESNNEVPKEILEKARAMGHTPKDKWTGDPEKWVDEKTYVERGEQFLPYLKRAKDKLEGELGAVKGELGTVTAALKAANASIKALEESNAADVRAQVEEVKKNLKAQLAAANEAGDHLEVAEITEKLVEVKASQKDAEERDKKLKEAAPTKGAEVAIPPEITKWMDQNRDFFQITKNAMLANALAAEKRHNGDTRKSGQAVIDFMEEVKAEVEELTGSSKQRGGDGKVGSGNGGGGRGSGSGGKSFNDLPADAKDYCDKQAKRLVGPGRAHKDVESWRKSYAKQYFEME